MAKGSIFKRASVSVLALGLVMVQGCAADKPATETSPAASPLPSPAPSPLTSPIDAAPDMSSSLKGRAMAAAAHPEAVKAAVAVLEKGGHAVDAAIAAHTVLGLVEPQSSGLGGGAFMLVYDADSRDITVYDGRETAPSSIDENLFRDQDGKIMNFLAAWQSGLSVGAPGAVALYEAAHEDHGLLDWAENFQHAELLAREGFTVTPRLAEMLANPRLRTFTQLDDNAASANYFYPKDLPLEAGDLRDNPAYAKLIAAIAEQGASAFYEGEIPLAIERAVKMGDVPGALTAEDVSNYEVIERPAVCGPFRNYRICSAPPPSSGSVAMPMIMGLYERFAGEEGLAGSERLLAFVDAQRLAYADRDHYVADADHVMVPYKELIDPVYLDARAKDRLAPDAKAAPGDPGMVLSGKPMIDMWGRDATEHAPGTTHLSIVDIHGNAVSMTATVEAAFGSSRWVPEGGFLLNNELTDFSRDPRKNGKLTANAPAPLKRPRSSMSPTIVLDDETGRLVMVTGSPGGNSIIAYTAKTLLAVLEWGMRPQAAADMPNIIARGDAVNVEIGVSGGQAAADTLKAAGYTVREREGENSGLHIILAHEDHYEGAADSRREGQAVEVVVSP